MIGPSSQVGETKGEKGEENGASRGHRALQTVAWLAATVGNKRLQGESGGVCNGGCGESGLGCVSVGGVE